MSTVEEMAGVSAGSIVIMREPNVELIICMERIAGIVTETGGVLCHLALVAMEMQIPYMVSDSRVLQFFQGETLHLDPVAGTLHRAIV